MKGGDKLNEKGIRECEHCDQHSGVKEDIIKATKDLEYVCTKMNKQCETVEHLYKEVDQRLKTKPFYVLISILITVLIFILGMQLTTYENVGNMQHNMEVVKYEIKADLARHEGETSQLIKRVDAITQEQKILMDQVFKHMTRYPMNHEQKNER